MHPAISLRTATCFLSLLVLLLSSPVVRADESVEKWRLRALDFEKRGMWAEACRCWEELGRKDRAGPGAEGARDAYHRSLRRLHLSVRQADTVYRAAVAKLTAPQALDLYEQVLAVLTVAHPDKDRSTFNALFQAGLSELRDAIEEPAFLRNHFPDAKDSSLSASRARLRTWPLTRVGSRSEAREQALAIARAASREGVAMRPGAIAAMVLEFAAGACNALDAHSLFVTPGQLGLLQAALRGKLVGTGLELVARDNGLQVGAIVPGSPAADKGLRRGDLVYKIGGASVEALPPEIAAERLRGEAGVSVEVEVGRLGKEDELERLTVKLVRRACPVPSVEAEAFDLDEGLAVQVRINYFAETTLAEVKAALASPLLMGSVVKGVVLDLRGNPGGLFDSAVSVAEQFLPEGVVVVGSSPFKKFNKTFKTDAAGPYQMPLVVLIDADTASAAEVLAGAIKDNRSVRGTALLVGQTTYGKGSIQCMIPLDKSAMERPAALKLTVARLFSPGDQPYTGKGVSPDMPFEPMLAAQEARKLLQDMVKRLLREPAPMPMPPA